MKTNKYNKVAVGVISFLLPLSSVLLFSCADLDYTEQNTRDEDWTFEYFENGIKNLVFDVYAQVYNNELASNSAYFLAGATDEAQYALETGAVNNYVNGGWSPANPYSNTWDKSYTAIADVNMYLEKIDQADISDWQYNPDYNIWVQQLEIFPYELRFLRAYFYFELFKTYGNVPLVTTTLTNGQANSIERTSEDEIVKFIVEESSFFKTNFLVTEGFVKQENFIGMFGVVGLAECCNHLLGFTDVKRGFGMDPAATVLGKRIMDAIEKRVADHVAPYCDACSHRYRLHAQVGIETDGMDDSPGTRIPVGAEPAMWEQLEINQVFHPYFPTGTGDIFKFEETWAKTPEAVLPIIQASLERGLRYFSGYLENNDVVRVTGYLVKKSEIEKLRAKKQSLNNVTVFGMGAQDGGHALDRRIQKHA